MEDQPWVLILRDQPFFRLGHLVIHLVVPSIVEAAIV